MAECDLERGHRWGRADPPVYMYTEGGGVGALQRRPRVHTILQLSYQTATKVKMSAMLITLRTVRTATLFKTPGGSMLLLLLLSALLRRAWCSAPVVGDRGCFFFGPPPMFPPRGMYMYRTHLSSL